MMFDPPSFDSHERVLCAHDAGVLYAPEIHRIPVRLTEIFSRSSVGNRPTREIADQMARQLLSEAR